MKNTQGKEMISGGSIFNKAGSVDLTRRNIENSKKETLHLFSKRPFYAEEKATQSYDFMSHLFDDQKWSQYGPNQVSKKI